MLKKFGFIIFAIFILLTGIIQVQAETVDINVAQDNLLDVVLTVGKTDTNLTTFQTDLTNALVTKGVPLDKIKIQAIQSANVSAGNTSSGWETYDHTNNASKAIAYYRPYYQEVNGNYNIDNHIVVSTTTGTNIDFYGYGAPGYKDFMIMPNYESGKKTIEFTITEGAIADALNGAGFFFNTKLSPASDNAARVMSGYLLFFLYPSGSNIPAIKIYKFENINVNTFHNATGQPIQSYAGFSEIAYFQAGQDTQRNVKIEATSESVSMWYDGSPVTFTLTGTSNTSNTISLPKDFSEYGFGPIVGYTDHGCGSHTHFTFNNVKMTTESSKRFSEVIREPEWRDESKRFIINAEDGVVADFSDPIALGEILSRLGNENIDYIGWGKNETDANAFIVKNSGNGLFVDKDQTITDTYNEQINEMAKYIYNEYINSVQNNTDKLIYGSPSSFSITPASEKSNTIDVDWPNGKWKIDHIHDFYDNSTGIAPYDNLYLNNLDINYVESGKYDVYYKDVLVKVVYVHRRPVAGFNVSLDSSLNVNVTSNAYDPDHQTATDKGISNISYFYKKTSDTVWTSGLPTVLVANNEYILKQVVKDEYNVESYPYLRYISTSTSNATAKPIAEFTITPSRLLTYISQVISYSDTSYDSNGKSITDRLWTITKNDVSIYTGATQKTSFVGESAGSYKISLKVKNSDGIWSEEVSRVLTLVRDTTAVTVTSDTTNNTTHYQPKIITLNFTDEIGGSGFKNRFVVISSTNTTPSSWGSMGTNSTYSYLLNKLGTNYMHYKAYDYAGNEKIGVFGPFTLTDNEAPTLPTQNSTPTQGVNEWSKVSIQVDASGSTDNFTPEADLIYEVKVDSGNYVVGKTVTLTTEGSHTVNFRVKDSTGNISTVSTRTYNIDLTSPTKPSYQITNTGSNYVNNQWSKTNATLTLSGSTDTGGSGLKSYQYKIGTNDWQTGSSLTLNQSGIFSIQYRSEDNAGNLSDVGTVEIKVDLESPTNATVVSDIPLVDGTWYKSPVTFTASNSTDNLTSSDALKYYVSHNSGNFVEGKTFTVNTNGNNTVQFKVIDEAGNISLVSTSVNIDQSAPSAPVLTMTSNELSYTAGTWASKPVTVNLGNSTDTGGSGLKLYSYKVDKGDWEVGNSIVFNASGEHVVSYRSVDNAGNLSSETSVQVKLDLEKSGEPTISFNPEYTTEWTNKDTTISADYAEDDITVPTSLVYKVSLDGVSYTDGKSITLTENGDYKVYFKVVDNGNNETVVSRTFKLDKTNPNSPTASLTTDDKNDYTENTWTNKKVTISLNNPSDIGGSGLRYNQMKINDGEWLTLNTLSFDKSGTYTVYYKSFDNAGNESDVVSKIIKVDFEKPEIYEINTTIDSIDKISVKVETNDLVSGLEEKAYRIYNGKTWSDWISKIDLIFEGYTREETVELKVEVKDNAGNIQLVTKEVTTLKNTSPTAKDDTYIIDEDKVLLMDVILNDIDADLLTPEKDVLSILSVSALSKTNAGTISIVENELKFSPNRDFNGEFTFSYTMQDAYGAQSVGLVTIDVTPVNDQPIANNDNSTVLEDQSISINVLSNDSDVETNLNVVSVSSASNGQVVSNGSSITYTPKPNYFGRDSFTYTVSDGNLTVSASVSIEVIAVNDKPIVLNDQSSTAYKTLITIDVLGNDSDTDGDKLSVVSVSSPSNGKASITGDQISYQPNDSFVGVDTFTITVSDGKAQVTSSVTIVVEKPIVSKETTTVELPNDDEESDPKVNRDPKNGEIEIAGESVYYTPKPNFTGIDSYIIEVVEDGKPVEYQYITKVENGIAKLLGFGLSLQDETFKLKNDETFTFNLDELLGKSIDLSNLEVTVQPVDGKVEVFEGKLVYTPNQEFIGNDAIIFSIIIDGKATPLAAVMEVSDNASKPLFTVFCYVGWLIGAILLLLIHRKTNPLFDKLSRNIVYVIQGIIALLSICLVRYYFGYLLSISFYVIYFVGLYFILMNEMIRAEKLDIKTE